MNFPTPAQALNEICNSPCFNMRLYRSLNCSFLFKDKDDEGNEVGDVIFAIVIEHDLDTETISVSSPQLELEKRHHSIKAWKQNDVLFFNDVLWLLEEWQKQLID